jgi:hypothetical protein
MIKTFRALLAADGQDTIRLSTINGMTGYRIKKFQLMPELPGTTSYELIVKVWTVEQDTIDSTVDFSNSRLLAAAYLEGLTSTTPGDELSVIFDNITFNQDIFITCKNENGSNGANYYLELEQTKLDLSEATVATLKDMRGTN